MDARNSLRTGEFTGFVYEMPRRFATRPDMEQHFLDDMRIERHILRRVSDYMVDVVQIFSFPLVHNDGRFLALLSIDSREYFSTGELPRDAAARPPIVIDSERLRGYLNGLRTMFIQVGPSR
jgi:hypothetical protein